MAIDPNIALSYKPVEIQSPLQQYAQVASIQHAQQQNELARMQMDEYARARQEDEGLRNYLRGADLSTPEGRNKLMEFGKTGLAYAQQLQSADKARLERDKLEHDIRNAQEKRRLEQLGVLGSGLASVMNDPSDANLIAAFDRLDAVGIPTDQLRTQFASVVDPNQRKQMINAYATGTEEGRKALQHVAPKVKEVKTSTGQIIFIDENPYSPTYGKEVRQSIAAGMTPYEQAGLGLRRAELGVSQANVALRGREADLAAQRLGFEKGKVAHVTTDEAGNTRFFDASGKEVTPTGAAGGAAAPVMGKPSAQFAKDRALRQQMGRDLDTAISQLSVALQDGGLIDQSTGSGAGRLVDIGNAFVGRATPGAIAIGKLKPIADLVLKMVPRFEGPQSDKDTKSYNEAAAQLADPTIPTQIRKEAGHTVLRLMQNRKGQFATSEMAAQGVSPAAKSNAVDTNNPLLK